MNINGDVIKKHMRGEPAEIRLYLFTASLTDDQFSERMSYKRIKKAYGVIKVFMSACAQL